MLYHIYQEHQKGLICKPHILNEYDKGTEFPVEIIESLTLRATTTEQLAKIKGFVSSKYSFYLKYDGSYFFIRQDDKEILPVDEILETPDTLDNLSNYPYVYVLGWTPM